MQHTDPTHASNAKYIQNGYFFTAGLSQGKNGPLGGQQAEGAAWGLF